MTEDLFKQSLKSQLDSHTSSVFDSSKILTNIAEVKAASSALNNNSKQSLNQPLKTSFIISLTAIVVAIAIFSVLWLVGDQESELLIDLPTTTEDSTEDGDSSAAMLTDASASVSETESDSQISADTETETESVTTTSASDTTSIVSSTSTATETSGIQSTSNTETVQSSTTTTVTTEPLPSYQKAILPFKRLEITQMPFEGVTHNGKLAYDFGSQCVAYAPFDAIVKGYSKSANTVWITSKNKVQYADGTVDYMTIMLQGADSVDEILKIVGTELKQGQYFYEPGSTLSGGTALIHMEVIRGDVISTEGDVYIEQAFHLTSDVQIVAGGGLAWVYK